jgi:hypothetical protein
MGTFDDGNAHTSIAIFTHFGVGFFLPQHHFTASKSESFFSGIASGFFAEERRPGHIRKYHHERRKVPTLLEASRVQELLILWPGL